MGTGRVIGIGGVFFKSQENKKLGAWYSENLGIEQDSGNAIFKWHSFDQPEVEQVTAWSIFAADSTYFDPGKAPFMVNYIVDDLDAILAKLGANGVRIDPKREDHDYGRFAWIFDPDGNKIELWEPAAPEAKPS
jgi:catechol 2,3-dioxygenase-like lactoylglutathione lyase family enzyme